MDDFLFHVPTRIHFNKGIVNDLPLIIEKLGVRILLVTEEILKDYEIPQRIRRVLDRGGLETLLFDEFGSTSTTRLVEKGIELLQKSRAQLVLGLGGVRLLSLAKCIAGLGNGERTVDSLLAGEPIDSKPLPYIAIPTAFRDPFLCSDTCFLIDGKNRESGLYKIPGSAPVAAVVDPDLSSSLGGQYVSAVLLSTLLTALEGYFSRASNFLSDSLFLKAVSKILAILEDPEMREEEVREQACKGGISSSIGLTMSSMGFGSAVAFALNGKLMVPKSSAGAIMLPYVLEDALENCPSKVARIAPILGIHEPGEPAVELAGRVVRFIRSLIDRKSIPLRLRDFEVTREDLTSIAAIAATYPGISHLPRPVTAEELLNILKMAY